MTANAGYHAYATGDVLTAAQVQYNLQNQTVMYFASSAARTTALTGVTVEGMVSYIPANGLEYYNGSAWTTVSNPGDITGVTAGTGISGGGTSGTVTVTNSMATEITAAGDIIVGTGSGTFDNLPIGTTAQVLTADTTVSPYKVKWATPASGASFAGCSLYKSATQNLTNNAATTITFNSELIDVGGYHDTATNTSRITIPSGKAGYYSITAKVSFLANATGIRVVYIYLNGANINNAARSIVSANENEAVITTQLYSAAVADYFEIIVYQNSGSTLTATNGAAETTFAITYLGA